MDRASSPLGTPDDEPGRSSQDDRLEALIASLPPAPGIRHVDDPDDGIEDIGDVDIAIAEGRAYPHEIVAAWLETWGRPGRKPFKEWLADQNG